MGEVTGFCNAGGRFPVYTKKEIDEKLKSIPTEDSVARTAASGAQSTASEAQRIANEALPKSGGIMTGALITKVAAVAEDYTITQVRNITISMASPSGGNNGDIWLKYT